MTLFEIAFSIPGIIFMCVVGPYIFLAALEILLAIIKAPFQIINEIALAVRKEKTDTIPAPVAQNDHEPVSMRDTEALAYISNHPAMRFHRPAA